MDRFLSTDRSSSTSFKKSPKMSSELVEIDKKKKKKEKSFRRFIPAIFSKDNRKDNESSKRKSKDERCFTHYQQPGRFSRCSESSHSNNDGKMQVELNQSLSGSIIEERLNEIKHDLFSPEGNMHSPSNDVLDTSFNSSSVDVRREENQWVLDRDSGRGRSDSQNFNRNLSQQNQCALKRQYSFQETMSFHRNCAPSGRVSAPPSQRFLIRSRSVHPMERPLPAIPQNNAFVNEHPSEYKENEPATTQKAIMVTPKGARYIVHTAQKNNSDLSYTYADKNVQRSSNIQQQLSNNQNDKNFRCSPTSSLKSNDYADSSYTANSSQKSELSPTSSKSGEYYLLGSPHPSNQTSSNDSLADNRHNLVPQNIKVEINEVEEHLYDKTPSTNNLNLIQGNECQDSQNDSASHKVELNDGKNNPEMNQDTPLYDSYPNNHVDYKDTERQKKMTNSKNLNQKLEQDSKFDQDKSNQYHENHSSPINKQILFENDQSERVLKKNNLHDNHPSEKSVSQSQPQFIRKKNFHPQESQPNDQVLIASPQGDNYPIYDTPPRSLSALEHRGYSTADSPKKISSMNNSQNVLTNDLDLSNGSRTTQQNSSPDKNNHQQPEQIYNYNSNDLTPPSRSPPKEGMNYKNINQSCKSNISKQMHSNESQSPKSQGQTHHGRNEKQIKQNFQTSPGQGYQASSESKESLYSNSCATNRPIPLSPQKKEMIQHLQAYYWHRKNIEVQRRSLIGMESLKAQEYAYWQQMQAISRDPNSPVRKEYNKQMFIHNQVTPPNRRIDYGPMTKIERPIHVRPLPSPKNELSLRSNNKPDVHFTQSIPSNYYMRNNVVLADCSSAGPKRVSFSNQSNMTQVGNGQWPTKHGSAPEPPTRKNKMYGSPVHFESPNALYAKQQLIPHREHEVDRSYQTSPCLSSSQTSGMSLKRYSTPTGSHENSGHSLTQNNLQDTSYNSETTDGESSISFNDSESGSEVGVSQRITRQYNREEEWNADGKNRYSNEVGGTGKAEGEGANDHPGRRIVGVGVGIGGGASLAQGRSSGVGAGRSRDEPRRHTLSGDHQSSALLHHQQFNAVAAAPGQPIHPLHPRHLPPPHSQYGLSSRHTTMDLEMGTKSRQRKSPLPRGYPPPSHSAMLFDDDPGIMSEVETSSTGFRRGGKQRSSLPVVRTPSKTLERPLGLVFLQYRNETKRALLPNEITSIDTVKALFVRSFPKQLTMEYLDSPHVKIYIHDSNKDMFYELEDLRSHLRDIRDRSVLRLFESDGVAGMPGNLGIPGGPVLPAHWEDQSYFSEPEFDSEFQHQHIHKSKSAKNSSASSGYYMSGSSTLPRGGALLRPYSPATGVLPGPPSAAVVPGQGPKALGTPGGGAAPAKPLRNYHCAKTPLGSLGGSARFSRDSSVSLYSIPDRLHGESGYMSSPERGGTGGVVPVPGSTGSSSGPGSTTSSRYPPGPYSAGSSYEDPYYSQYSGTVTPVIDEEARIRVEHMERQLANLTGLVQKALTHAPCPNSSPRDYLQVPAARDPYARSADDTYLRTDVKPPKLGKDKSVSFEKSVSFSDEPPDMNSPKQHSPQHTERERERHKPTPPPKPVALAAGQYVYRDLALTPEMYNQLRGLQKKAKDLRQEIKNLRRMSQAQAHTVRETIRDTFITIRAMLLSSGDNAWAAGDAEKLRLSREEDLYKQEMLWLEKDLTKLESTVEELRGNVINRKTRVNMSDVENMALILSKASKTVADLKVRFPNLQEGMKGLLSSEMEKVMREEKFLKEEPDRLESALKRCKKLTGTLVTLKRLASVQEQRLPNSGSVDAEEAAPITPTSGQHSKQAAAPVPAERTLVGSALVSGGSCESTESSHCAGGHTQRPENALDALLDELQTFSRPASQLSQVSTTSTQPPIHLAELGRSASGALLTTSSLGRAPNIAEIGRKGSVDSSCLSLPQPGGMLRRLHSYPSSSDTDTSPPIGPKIIASQEDGNASGGEAPQMPPKPPLPERNAELLQLASARRVPPPPPPRTSSRSPLASPTSPQLPPRNPCAPGGTLRRGVGRNGGPAPPLVKAFSESNHKPPGSEPQPLVINNNVVILSTSNSSSCESVNSQEGLQSKKERQEQLEQRHQELLRKQKALQEQYARLQQLQRNASGCAASVPPAPPDLLKKTGSESNLLAKMGLGLSTTSGSLTSLSNSKPNQTIVSSLSLPRNSTTISLDDPPETTISAGPIVTTNSTTTSKVYETDIL